MVRTWVWAVLILSVFSASGDARVETEARADAGVSADARAHRKSYLISRTYVGYV